MNIHEIISSGLLESYVLGTATEKECIMIHDLCKLHPELVKEIEFIENALINYSSSNSTVINSKIKAKLHQELFKNTGKNSEPISKTIRTSHSASIKYYNIGIAASTFLLLVSGIYIILLHKKLNTLNNEIAELSTSKSFLANQLQIQKTSLLAIDYKLQIITNPKVKTVSLNGMNSLVSKSATIHWNKETQEVYFNAQSLPTCEIDKQYQLWAIVDGKPINAGIIESENQSVFQKMYLIKNAQAFAVTIEKKGGSISPSLETMCLLGSI